MHNLCSGAVDLDGKSIRAAESAYRHEGRGPSSYDVARTYDVRFV